MGSELSLFNLFVNAGLTVKLILLILLMASVLSWMIIFDRSRVRNRARQAA